ncbi:hypothetical protein Hanom_Chr12g01178881 [Helianthus anomalus]
MVVGRERETRSRGSNGTIVVVKVSTVTFKYIFRLMTIADNGRGRRIATSGGSLWHEQLLAFNGICTVS